MPTEDRRIRFHRLHEDGIFVMPNPWDIGSARYLASLGFPALATTSSGHAAALGRRDQAVTRDELLAHAESLAAAVDIPVSVDSERCFADDPAGVAETVRLIAGTGAAGCSIEDWDPHRARIDTIDVATERVAAAAETAHASGLVLTARAENRLYGEGDLEDIIARLRAYREAGADVLYAPGLVDLDEIARVVSATEAPVNVLTFAEGPSVGDLGSVGVRRVSTGGFLSRAVFGALHRAGRELLDLGTSTYIGDALPNHDLVEGLTGGASRPNG